MYTKTFKKIFLSILFISIFLSLSCNGCSKSGNSTQSFKVLNTNPNNGDKNIPPNTIISAQFSKQIDTTTVDSTSFFSTNQIKGTFSFTEKTVKFTPLTLLLSDTTYTVTITNKIKDISGNKLKENYTWSFKTGKNLDTTSPYVLFTSPENNKKDVTALPQIRVTFSERMNFQNIENLFFVTGNITGNITHSDSTFVFIPNNPFNYESTYTATIFKEIEDLTGNKMKENYSWSFTIIDTTAPYITLTLSYLEVISTNPEIEIENVDVNKSISIIFSEELNANTVTSESFFINNNITGTITCSGNTLFFKPDNNFEFSTKYTVTIKNSIESNFGKKMENDYILNFTTGQEADLVPPEVILITPENFEKNVSISQTISVTFSESINVNTVNLQTFYLNNNIKGIIKCNENTIMFLPEQNLEYSKTYSVIIKKDIEDLAGNKFGKDYIFYFTTGELPDTIPPQVIFSQPENNSLSVPINTSINILFSEPINPQKINISTFYINENIPFIVSTSGTTATISFPSVLSYSKKYTVTLKNNIEDLSGNRLGNDFIWSFTTAKEPDTIPPQIISVSPLSELTPVSTTIYVNFSEPIDIKTINRNTFIIDNQIKGTFSFENYKVTFTPDKNLLFNKTHTITLTTGIKDMGGNALLQNYSWNFTTEPALRWKQVSSGNSHSVGIKSDNSLWVWGNNHSGQLGTGSTENFYSPKLIESNKSWQKVSTGYEYSAAIQSDDSLWSWGLNNFGQLGDGTYSTRFSPVKIGFSNDWLKIECGESHSLAIKTDGSLWAWGKNNKGQLGDSTAQKINIPIQIGSSNNWLNISAGYEHSAGIRADGTLWSWGNNSKGQLGDSTKTFSYYPIQLGNDLNWKEISCGYEYTAAIKNDGTLWAWGDNTEGQLGNGANTTKYKLYKINQDNDWDKIFCGYKHTIAIKQNGTIWAWGLNYYGQLGNETVDKSNVPVKITADSNWMLASGGYGHSMIINSDNLLWSFGSNSDGQIGNTQTANKNIPTNVNSESTWIDISSNGYHSFIINNEKKLYGAGRNINGQLGDSTLNNSKIFKQIKNSFSWKKVACGYEHTLAIKEDNSLWAWGSNDSGQLGDGTKIGKSYPIQISYDYWKIISCGENFSIAIKIDGSLWAWGSNGSGQLGDGTNTSKSSPVLISLDTDWIAISCGEKHCLALKTDGSLWAWGSNYYGQLGNGNEDNNNIPIKIGNDWKQIATGTYFSLAIKTDGSIWAWGNNNNGQLGIGSTDNKNYPEKIDNSYLWDKIVCGDSHCLAIKKDGSLWAWGYNAFGQLGDLTYTNRTKPIQIGIDLNWKNTAAGKFHSFSIKNNGYVFSWGLNNFGQLGDNTAWEEIPVKIE